MSIRDQLQTTLGTAYTLERQLTGGGMSHVFVAEETALRRKVVVKVLPQEVAAGVNADRFKREIMLAARLQHPHIVPVLSTGETNGVPYYTMPFVEGESIRAILARTGIALSITEVIGVLRDVSKALAYAHDHGIVHRDIKPDNVLMSGGSATVTDFGIAKALAASRTDPGSVGEQHQPTLTQIGTSIGTPAYMAPEQAAGDPDTDHRADIYSFGCMAYELLAGRAPFVEKSPRRLMAAHMHDVPENVKVHRPETPDALAQLVMKCLEKEPGDRPQRAGEIVGVLEGVTSGGGHAAMPASLLGGQGMLRKALLAYTVAFIAVAVIARLAITAIGLPDWVVPGALLVMALGLPVILFTAYVHHTTKVVATQTPTYTPGGHATTRTSSGMATLALKASPHVSWRRTWMGGGYALAAFVLLIAGYMTMRALGVGPFASLFAAGRMSENEKLLVSDFTSSTADTTLAPVVTDAFRTALAQSRSVSVIEPTEIQQVLRRMQRPANTRIDFATAREIATREGLKAVVVGEIISIGGKYAISTRLVSPQTGEELTRIRVTADNDGEVLPAIDKLAKDLRARMGESLRQVQSTPALERVTTQSLEALKKYVQGSRLMSQGGEFGKGSALLEEAIALDTTFAMAYRRLAAEYSNRGMTERSGQLVQKAYDHRDRLSDEERYLVEAQYYFRGPRQDITRMVSSYETLIELKPDNYTALNNVAIGYRYLRNWAKAEEALKRSITLSGPAVSYNQLVWTQYQMGKREDALRTLAQFDSVYPNTQQRMARRWEILFAERQYDSANAVSARVLAVSRDSLNRSLYLDGDGRVALVQGRLQDALRLSRQSVTLASRARPDFIVDQAGQEAIMQALVRRDPQGAGRQLDAALAQKPIETVPVPERPYTTVILGYALAGRPDRVAALTRSFEEGTKTVVQYQDDRDRLLFAGARAFAAQQYDEAIRAFKASSDLGDCIVCGQSVIALAFDRAGQADSAIAAYRRYVEQPDYLRFVTDPSWLPHSLQRLGELYEAKGDVPNAVKYYREFIDLWKRADPELQPRVAEVRRRISRLGDIETKR
jgi:tetratricopeptide (TPR) repeat protein